MASPTDTLKASLFGHLKSYSNAVQDAFEQRIARPLLAFKRDLSRPTSETRATAAADQELALSSRVQQESSSSSSSSPLEIIDIDTNNTNSSSGPLKSIFDKVKSSLSPAVKRRTSENVVNDGTDVALITKTTTKVKSQKQPIHQKSVSFADNIDIDNDSDTSYQYSIDERNQIIRNAHHLADKILMDSIDLTAGRIPSIRHFSDDEFEHDFHQTIKPRRLSLTNTEDLVYQDLSAEIVAYVLKHALRTLKKEQTDLSISTHSEIMMDRNDEDDDFIDLK